ncbi:MAG: hypothetical protein OEW75_08150 [Cyclobacteriaceae bacterium]|nr:hypothetical protein [Cyclobacteriaceae bacterium]
MNCSKCFSYVKNNQKTGTSVLSAVLVALIPKCGLCVMAYSSAIAMCGGGTMYMAENDWVSYIPIILSILILFLILKKKKGKRTFIAFIVALAGTFMIVGAHQIWIDFSYYTVGNVMLFLAIWINGSMFSVLHQSGSSVTSKLSWLR